MEKRRMRPEMLLFFLLMGFVALGNGLSDSVYSNYFKEVYNVTAVQRGYIEFPRELPGILCTFIIALLPMFTDLKLAILAQVLACIGLVALGLFAPAFGIMLLFLFINSTGMHLFMPLQDGIGLALAEPDKIGRRMGQYAAFRTSIGFLCGIIVFFGFRKGLFSFKTPVITIFLIAAAAFAVAMVIAILLERRTRLPSAVHKRIPIKFRKEYRSYYLLTILYGVQKQITYVYGSWVIIDLLLKGADIMALLAIGSSFCGILFMNVVSRWFDRLGIRRMMLIDALTFIIMYTLFGFAVWGITTKVLPSAGWPVILVYILFVLDRLSLQLGIVRSVYLRSIAVSNDEVTQTLSLGVSMDHVVSIIAAQLSGLVWMYMGPQWVFFIAAVFSLGNLAVAWRIPKKT